MTFYLLRFNTASDILHRVYCAEKELGLLDDSGFNVMVVGNKCAVNTDSAFGELLFHHVLDAEKHQFKTVEEVTLENLESVWQKLWDDVNNYNY